MIIEPKTTSRPAASPKRDQLDSEI